MRIVGLCVFVILAAATAAAEPPSWPPAQGSLPRVLSFEGQHANAWHLVGENPLLIGGYGDNFSYDGSRVQPADGMAEVVLDAALDVGSMVVRLQGSIAPEKDRVLQGDILMIFSVVKGGPPHRENGVADFVYLHGDTGQEDQTLPRTRAFLAAWGTVDVMVNGETVYRGLEGHMMYTEKLRDPQTMGIRNRDGSGAYSPMLPSEGSAADPQGRELHFLAHDLVHDPGNIPPNSVWLHVNFASVTDLSAGPAQQEGDGGGSGNPGPGFRTWSF